MSNSQFKEIFGQAMRLNMQYYGGLYNVTRDYLSALRSLADQNVDRKPAQKSPAKSGTPAIRPLILAAQAGKVATASFSITNNTGQEVAADPQVSDTLKQAGVTAEPHGRMVANGEDVVFTLKFTPENDMPPDSDIHGSLSAGHFGDKEIPVVLRRLPPHKDTPKPKCKPAARKKT